MGYRRSQQDKHKLKKLYEETRTKYGSGVYYNEDKGRLIFYSARGSGCPKELRRRSNKKLRRSKDTLNHGLYRRIYDYWWELY